MTARVIDLAAHRRCVDLLVRAQTELWARVAWACVVCGVRVCPREPHVMYPDGYAHAKCAKKRGAR